MRLELLPTVISGRDGTPWLMYVFNAIGHTVARLSSVGFSITPNAR